MENDYSINENKNNTIDTNNYYFRNKHKNFSFDKYPRNATTLHNLYNKFLILKYPNSRNRGYFNNNNNTIKNNVATNNVINNINFNNENNLNNKQYYNEISKNLNDNSNKDNEYKLQEEKQIIFSNKTPNIQRHNMRIGYTPNKINQPYQLSNEIQFQEINDKKTNIDNNNNYNNNYNNNISDNYNRNFNNNYINYKRKILNTPIKASNYNYFANNDQNDDDCSRSSKNKGYLSPVITNIAKHYYLSGNPYSDKNEDLGPSNLRINPIVYPIDSYRFDFNRYIRGDYVKKFV